MVGHPPGNHEPQELKGKKIATTGVCAIATFMVKQVLTKHGLDGNKDVTTSMWGRAINSRRYWVGIPMPPFQCRAAPCCAGQGNERDFFHGQ